VPAESDLYAPVKAFLEKQGYVVKGEVRGCDVVAVRDGVPLVVELKQRVTLELILQGVDRLALADAVYLAVPVPPARSRGVSPWDRRVVKLCRRVGLGLMTISKRGRVEIVAEPVPYAPRKNGPKAAALLAEHARRTGDPNLGGTTRIKIVTAYRQEALRLARAMADGAPRRPRDLKDPADAPNAGRILRDNHYGWFERREKGVYALTEEGRKGLARFGLTGA
jgi:hypothetical protein